MPQVCTRLTGGSLKGLAMCHDEFYQLLVHKVALSLIMSSIWRFCFGRQHQFASQGNVSTRFFFRHHRDSEHLHLVCTLATPPCQSTQTGGLTTSPTMRRRLGPCQRSLLHRSNCLTYSHERRPHFQVLHSLYACAPLPIPQDAASTAAPSAYADIILHVTLLCASFWRSGL